MLVWGLLQCSAKRVLLTVPIYILMLVFLFGLLSVLSSDYDPLYVWAEYLQWLLLTVLVVIVTYSRVHCVRYFHVLALLIVITLSLLLVQVVFYVCFVLVSQHPLNAHALGLTVGFVNINFYCQVIGLLIPVLTWCILMPVRRALRYLALLLLCLLWLSVCIAENRALMLTTIVMVIVLLMVHWKSGLRFLGVNLVAFVCFADLSDNRDTFSDY